MVRIIAAAPNINPQILSGTQLSFAVKTDELCNLKIVAVTGNDMEVQELASAEQYSQISADAIFEDLGLVTIVAFAEKDGLVYDSYTWIVNVMTEEQLNPVTSEDPTPVYVTNPTYAESENTSSYLMLALLAAFAFL